MNPPESGTLLKKILHFVLYRERSSKEVGEKLKTLGVYPAQREEWIAWLITERYLNEERFARAYASGKFRILHWGRIKIIRGLQDHNVSARNISLALASEIPEEDYLKTMENLAEKYLEKLGERGIMANDKTVKYLFQKGFELQLAAVCVKSLSQSEI